MQSSVPSLKTEPAPQAVSQVSAMPARRARQWTDMTGGAGPEDDDAQDRLEQDLRAEEERMQSLERRSEQSAERGRQRSRDKDADDAQNRLEQDLRVEEERMHGLEQERSAERVWDRDRDEDDARQRAEQTPDRSRDRSRSRSRDRSRSRNYSPKDLEAALKRHEADLDQMEAQLGQDIEQEEGYMNQTIRENEIELGVPVERERLTQEEIPAVPDDGDGNPGDWDELLDGPQQRAQLTQEQQRLQQEQEDKLPEYLTNRPRNPLAARILRGIAGVPEPVPRTDRYERMLAKEIGPEAFAEDRRRERQSVRSLVEDDEVTEFNPFIDCREEPEDACAEDDETGLELDDNWKQGLDLRTARTPAELAFARQIKMGMSRRLVPGCEGQRPCAPASRPCAPPMVQPCAPSAGQPFSLNSCEGSDLDFARSLQGCDQIIGAAGPGGNRAQHAMFSPVCSPVAQRPSTPYPYLRSPCTSDIEDAFADEDDYLGDDAETLALKREMELGMAVDKRLSSSAAGNVQSAGDLSSVLVKAQQSVLQAQELLQADPSNERARLQLELAQNILRRAGPAASAAIAMQARNVPTAQEDIDGLSDAELARRVQQAEQKEEEAETKHQEEAVVRRARAAMDKIMTQRAAGIRSPAPMPKDKAAAVAKKVLEIARPTGPDGKKLTTYEILKLRVAKAKEKALTFKKAADDAHRTAKETAEKAKEDAAKAKENVARARVRHAREDVEAAKERYNSLKETEEDAREAMSQANVELEALRTTLKEQEEQLKSAEGAQAKTLMGGLTFEDLMNFDSDCESEDLDEQAEQLCISPSALSGPMIPDSYNMRAATSPCASPSQPFETIGPEDAWRITQGIHRSLGHLIQRRPAHGPGPVIGLEGECCTPKETQTESEKDPAQCEMDDIDRAATAAAKAAEEAAHNAQELADHEETIASRTLVACTRELVRSRVEAVNELVKVHKCVTDELAKARTALTCAETAYVAAVTAYGTDEEKAALPKKKVAVKKPLLLKPVFEPNLTTAPAAIAVHGDTGSHSAMPGRLHRTATGELVTNVDEHGFTEPVKKQDQKDNNRLAQSTGTEVHAKPKRTLLTGKEETVMLSFAQMKLLTDLEKVEYYRAARAQQEKLRQQRADMQRDITTNNANVAARKTSKQVTAFNQQIDALAKTIKMLEEDTDAKISLAAADDFDSTTSTASGPAAEDEVRVVPTLKASYSPEQGSFQIRVPGSVMKGGEKQPLLDILGTALQGGDSFVGMDIRMKLDDPSIKNQWSLKKTKNERLTVTHLAEETGVENVYVIEGGMFRNDHLWHGFHVTVEERVPDSAAEDSDSYFCVTAAIIGTFKVPEKGEERGIHASKRVVEGFTSMNKAQIQQQIQKRKKNRSLFEGFLNMLRFTAESEEEGVKVNRAVSQCVGDKIFEVKGAELNDTVTATAVNNVEIKYTVSKVEEQVNIVIRSNLKDQMYVGLSDGTMGVLLKKAKSAEDMQTKTVEELGKKKLLTRGGGLYVGSFTPNTDTNEFDLDLAWSADDNSFMRYENGRYWGCVQDEVEENRINVYTKSFEAASVTNYTDSVAGLPTGADCRVEFVHGALLTGPLYAGVSAVNSVLTVWRPGFEVPQMNPLITSDSKSYDQGMYHLVESDLGVEFVSKVVVHTESKKGGDMYIGNRLNGKKFGPGVQMKHTTAKETRNEKEFVKLLKVQADKGVFNEDRFWDGWRETLDKEANVYRIERFYGGELLFYFDLSIIGFKEEEVLHGGTENEDDAFDLALAGDDTALKSAFVECEELKKKVSRIMSNAQVTLNTNEVKVNDGEDGNPYAHLVGTSKDEGSYSIWFQRPDGTRDLARLYFTHTGQVETPETVYQFSEDVDHGRADNGCRTCYAEDGGLKANPDNLCCVMYEHRDYLTVLNRKDLPRASERKSYTGLNVHKVFIGYVNKVVRKDFDVRGTKVAIETEQLHGRVLQSDNCQDGVFVPLLKSVAIETTNGLEEAQKKVQTLEQEAQGLKQQQQSEDDDQDGDHDEWDRRQVDMQLSWTQRRIRGIRRFLNLRKAKVDVLGPEAGIVYTHVMTSLNDQVKAFVTAEVTSFFKSQYMHQDSRSVHAIENIGNLQIWQEFVQYHRETYGEKDTLFASGRARVWTSVKRFSKLINRWLSNVAAYLVINRDYVTSMFALCTGEDDEGNGLYTFMTHLTQYTCMQLWSLIENDAETATFCAQYTDEEVWTRFANERLSKIMFAMDRGCFFAGNQGDAWRNFANSSLYVARTIMTSGAFGVWVGTSAIMGSIVPALSIASVAFTAPALVPIGTATALGALVAGVELSKGGEMTVKLFEALGDVSSHILQSTQTIVGQSVQKEDEDDVQVNTDDDKAELTKLVVDEVETGKDAFNNLADLEDWQEDNEAGCTLRNSDFGLSQEFDSSFDVKFDQVGCARVFQHFTRYMTGRGSVYAAEVLLQQSGTHTWGANTGNSKFQFGTGFSQSVNITLDNAKTAAAKAFAPGPQRFKKRSPVSYMGKMLFGYRDGLGISEVDDLAYSLRTYRNVEEFGDGHVLADAGVPGPVIRFLYDRLPQYVLQTDLREVYWLLEKCADLGDRFRRKLYSIVRGSEYAVRNLQRQIDKYQKWHRRIYRYMYVTTGTIMGPLARYAWNSKVPMDVEVPQEAESLEGLSEDETKSAKQKHQYRLQFAALKRKLDGVRLKIQVYGQVLDEYDVYDEVDEDDNVVGHNVEHRNEAKLMVIQIMLREWIRFDKTIAKLSTNGMPEPLSRKEVQGGIRKAKRSVAKSFPVKTFMLGDEVDMSPSSGRNKALVDRIVSVQQAAMSQLAYARKMKDLGAKLYIKEEQRFEKSDVQQKFIGWQITGAKRTIDAREEDLPSALQGLGKVGRGIATTAAVGYGGLMGWSVAAVASTAATGVVMPIAAVAAGGVLIGGVASGIIASLALQYETEEEMLAREQDGDQDEDQDEDEDEDRKKKKKKKAYREKNKDYMSKEEGERFLLTRYRPALENHTMMLDRVVSKFKIRDWRDKHEAEKAKRATTVTARAYNSGTKMGMLHMFLDNASTFSGIMDRAREFDGTNIAYYKQQAKVKADFYHDVIGKPKAQKEADVLQDNIRDLAVAVQEATGDEKAGLQAQLDDMVGRLQSISSEFALDKVDQRTLEVDKAMVVAEQTVKEAAKVKTGFQRDVVNYRKTRVHVRELEGNVRKLARALVDAPNNEKAGLKQQLDDMIGKISETGSAGGLEASEYKDNVMNPEKAVNIAREEAAQDLRNRASFVRDVIEAPRVKRQAQMFQDNIADLTKAIEAAAGDDRPAMLEQLMDIGEALAETAGLNMEAVDISMVNNAQASVGKVVVDTYQAMVGLKVAKDVGNLAGTKLRDAVFESIRTNGIMGEFEERVTGIMSSASQKRAQLQQRIMDLGALYEDTCPAFDDRDAMGTWVNGLYYASTAAEGVAMVAGLGGPVIELAGEGFAAGVETAYDMSVMNQEVYDTATAGVESWNSDMSDSTGKQAAIIMSDPVVQNLLSELKELKGELKQVKTAAASAAVLDTGNAGTYKAAATAMDSVVAELYNNGEPLPKMDSGALSTVPLAQAAVGMYNQLASEAGHENAKTAMKVFSGDIDRANMSVQDGNIVVETTDESGEKISAVFEGDAAAQMFGVSDDTNVVVAMVDNPGDKAKLQSIWLDNKMQVGVNDSAQLTFTGSDGTTVTFSAEQMQAFQDATGITDAEMTKPGWMDGVKMFAGNFAKRAAVMGAVAVAGKVLSAASKTGAGKAVTGAVSDLGAKAANTKAGKVVGAAVDAVVDTAARTIDNVAEKVGVNLASEAAESAAAKAANAAAEDAAQTVVKNRRAANLLAEGASFIGDATTHKRMTKNSGGKLMSNLATQVKTLGVVDDKVAKVLANAGVEVSNTMSKVIGEAAAKAAKTGAVGAADNVLIAASKKMTGANQGAVRNMAKEVSEKMAKEMSRKIAKDAGTKQILVKMIGRAVTKKAAKVAVRKAAGAAVTAAAAPAKPLPPAVQKASKLAVKKAVANKMARANLMMLESVTDGQQTQMEAQYSHAGKSKWYTRRSWFDSRDVGTTTALKREGDGEDVDSDYSETSEEEEDAFESIDIGFYGGEQDLEGGDCIEHDLEGEAQVRERFHSLYVQAGDAAKTAGAALSKGQREDARKHALEFNRFLEQAAHLLQDQDQSQRFIWERSQLRMLFDACSMFYNTEAKKKAEELLDAM